MHRTTRLLAAIAAVCLPAFAHAAAPPPDPVLAEATDLTGDAIFHMSGAPGMVLVVVKGDRSLVLGYGETAKGNGHAPDGASLVRLNSITKVFATETLASLTAEGKLRLTDPLATWWGGAKVPAFGQSQITLLDLATHSAGLPREITLERPDGAGQRNWPTAADRRSWLAGYALKWAPGTVAAYSNIGFDLLADAMESAAKAPYPGLLRDRVTGPLGMADTTFVPTPAQCERLMTGSGLGGDVPCLDQTATDGSGGLYSTGNDMALWLKHNLADSNGVLAISHAVYRPRQSIPAAIGFDEAGPMSGLGLGWVTVAGDGIHPTLIQKSGGGAGFMSYIAFAPGRDVGVFIVANKVDFAMFSVLTQGANGIIYDLVTR